MGAGEDWRGPVSSSLRMHPTLRHPSRVPASPACSGPLDVLSPRARPSAWQRFLTPSPGPPKSPGATSWPECQDHQPQVSAGPGPLGRPAQGWPGGCVLNTNLVPDCVPHNPGASLLRLVRIVSQRCALRGPRGQVLGHLHEVSLTPTHNPIRGGTVPTQ